MPVMPLQYSALVIGLQLMHAFDIITDWLQARVRHSLRQGQQAESKVLHRLDTLVFHHSLVTHVCLQLSSVQDQ